MLVSGVGPLMTSGAAYAASEGTAIAVHAIQAVRRIMAGPS